MGVQLTIDTVGWSYIGVAITWSVILYSAIGILWHNRQLPLLQMRRLPLVFTAITILHIYWTLCIIAHIIAPILPCAAEYWIMSILLPFGIAIFQVANTQFLYIACGQRRFRGPSDLNAIALRKRSSMLDDQTTSILQKLPRWLSKVDQITRLMIVVGIGMAFQVSSTCQSRCLDH